eukprot:COSAG04_NODE_254_length_18809_cov_8.025869_10_plen_206_part_00
MQRAAGQASPDGKATGQLLSPWQVRAAPFRANAASLCTTSDARHFGRQVRLRRNRLRDEAAAARRGKALPTTPHMRDRGVWVPSSVVGAARDPRLQARVSAMDGATPRTTAADTAILQVRGNRLRNTCAPLARACAHALLRIASQNGALGAAALNGESTALRGLKRAEAAVVAKCGAAAQKRRASESAREASEDAISRLVLRSDY